MATKKLNANENHSQVDNSKKRNKKQRKKKIPINYADRAKYVRQFDTINSRNRVNFTPQEKREISRKFNKLQKINTDKMFYKKIKSDKLIRKLKHNGAIVTKRGIFIARPLKGDGTPIKSVSITISKKGIIRFKKGVRTEYAIYLTKSQRKRITTEFKEVVNEIINSHSGIKSLIKTHNYTIQLIFGRYTGVNEYADIDLLNKYIADMNPESLSKLTGLRFVFYPK